MKDKIVLITGSSSGIGLATAQKLAQMGCEVIVTGRSDEKLCSAIEQIKAKTSTAKLKYYTVDFASQKSIRALSEKIKNDYQKIDVLINNAGGFFTEFKLTEDNLETTIATNHFAYFLLTNLLLDLLKKSDYARIINVSSESHYNGKINFESFGKDKNYSVRTAYSQSKLANVLFTFELADRLKNTHVTVNCLHPGFVKTNLGNKGTKWYLTWAWTLATNILAINVEDGAKTSVYLASSDEVKGVTGRYFDKCREKAPNPLVDKKSLLNELWLVSEEMCFSR